MIKKYYIIILLCIVCIMIPRTEEYTKIIPNITIINKTTSTKIGRINIKKIKLKEDLYKIGSEENNVEKHVTILKESIFPPTENSIVFLAAHSGSGKIAYFQELDKLQEKDEIILTLNNKNYYYEVKDIWEEKKNGYINVNKESKDQLVLTTCSPTKEQYQLVINCIKKES